MAQLFYLPPSNSIFPIIHARATTAISRRAGRCLPAPFTHFALAAALPDFLERVRHLRRWQQAIKDGYVRRRDQLSPELGRWTTELFFPEAAARLAPQPLRLSVLCSPARTAIYATSAEQQRYLTFGLAPERTYRMQLFGDEGPAMRWLLAEE